MTDPPDWGPDGQLQPGEWGDYGVGYYDRQGNRITMDRFSILHRNPEYKRLAQTTIGDLWISTVWLGMNHRFRIDDGDGLPLIFESMVFFDEPDEEFGFQHTSDQDAVNPLLHAELRQYIGEPFRYSTEEAAIRGHDLLCMEIRELVANIEAAQQIHDAAVDEQARKALRKRDKK